MNERFYIGELVDWLDADPVDDHPEVTVVSPRHWARWEVTERPWEQGRGYGYSVQYSDGDIGFEEERFLRRKPSPPTWEQRFHLTNLPREVTHV